MNYKKMWYQLKKQMLNQVGGADLKKENVLRRMSNLEVDEFLGNCQPPIKPIDIEIVAPDNLPEEIKKELVKVVRNWGFDK